MSDGGMGELSALMSVLGPSLAAGGTALGQLLGGAATGVLPSMLTQGAVQALPSLAEFLAPSATGNILGSIGGLAPYGASAAGDVAGWSALPAGANVAGTAGNAFRFGQGGGGLVNNVGGRVLQSGLTSALQPTPRRPYQQLADTNIQLPPLVQGGSGGGQGGQDMDPIMSLVARAMRR